MLRPGSLRCCVHNIGSKYLTVLRFTPDKHIHIYVCVCSEACVNLYALEAYHPLFVGLYRCPFLSCVHLFLKWCALLCLFMKTCCQLLMSLTINFSFIHIDTHTYTPAHTQTEASGSPPGSRTPPLHRPFQTVFANVSILIRVGVTLLGPFT